MWKTTALALVALCTAAVGAAAETAAERASSLKTWRAQCNDPDSDLRQAYVEAAIATGDVAIQRICIRLALESDDADIQNLGLRAAVAAMPMVTFAIQQPPSLATAIQRAGTDRAALEKIDNWREMRTWRVVQTGLMFAIREANITGGTSDWFALAGLTDPSDNYQGKATVVGSKLNWVGSAYVTETDCRLDLHIEPGAVLAGSFQCGSMDPFPVRAELL